MARKTLKNSNKQQQTREHGSEMVRSSELLPGWVPARLSETGKACRRFFETKEEAQKFIFETKRSGSVELAELAVEEKHVLGVIRQSQKYEPTLLLEAWRPFESEGTGNGEISRCSSSVRNFSLDRKPSTALPRRLQTIAGD
jgi:hypothetical protein